MTIFEGKVELEGVEIGRYADFGKFRDTIVLVFGSDSSIQKFPNLMLHSDCDGQWSPEEALHLKQELETIADAFSKRPPLQFEGCWQDDLIVEQKLNPSNLFESIFDVDGIPLIERLIKLTELSISKNLPILFQ